MTREQIYIVIHLPLYLAPHARTYCQSTVVAPPPPPFFHPRIRTCLSRVQHAYTIQVITMALERQSGCPREKYILPYLLVLACGCSEFRLEFRRRVNLYSYLRSRSSLRRAPIASFQSLLPPSLSLTFSFSLYLHLFLRLSFVSISLLLFSLLLPSPPLTFFLNPSPRPPAPPSWVCAFMYFDR